LICASAHSASTIFRRQYSTGMSMSGRKPTEILYLQARLGQGYHIYTSTSSFAKEGGAI
jgi:hypothetical protein